MRPANDKTQALRYLLLRHAWQRKNKIRKSIYNEVTNSLSVTNADNGFLVSWNNNGISHEKLYGESEFNLFIRGDKEKDKNYTIDYSTNNNLSKYFVNEAFNLADDNNDNKVESLLPVNIFTFFNYGILPIALWLIGGSNYFGLSILLVLLILSEYMYVKGKLIVPILMIGFIQLGLVYTAFIGQIIFLIIQLFDPNKTLLNLRLFLSFVCLLYTTIYVIESELVIFLKPSILLITLFSICSFLINFVYESHFRSFPLVLPFLSIGMFIDNNLSLSVLILGFTFLTFIIDRIGSHFFPLQQIK
jgi:hypothetical protein